MLGTFLENRVNNFLSKKTSEFSKVYIRVVSCSENVAEVMPGMKERYFVFYGFLNSLFNFGIFRYCDNNLMSSSFPYRAKTLFAFQEIDGSDVCFFGMNVQEYGSDCPEPNKRQEFLFVLFSIGFVFANLSFFFLTDEFIFLILIP